MSRRGRWTAAALAYGAAWLATAALGPARVEADMLATYRADLGPPSDVTTADLDAHPEWGLDRLYPTYGADAYSPAPFVVVMDRSVVCGPLSGEGRRSIHVWFFGLRRQLGSWMTWVS